MPLADAEHEILNVLLGRLMEQGLISEAVHDKAVDLVYSTIDFPDFFEYPVCCQEEGETNGCTENPK